MKPRDVLPYAEASWMPDSVARVERRLAQYPFSAKGARVLDLAAGPGTHTAAIVKAGASLVVWQDREPRFLEVARERIGLSDRVRFELRDMMDLPYAPASFDVALLLLSLHWAADEALLLRRLGTVVRPGGWLIVTETNVRRLFSMVRPRWKAAGHLLTPPLAVALRRKVLTTLWVFEGLTRRRLAGAGFEVVEWNHPFPHTFEAVCRRLPIGDTKSGAE